MPLIAHEDCVVIVIDAQPGFHPPDLPEADRAAAAQALDRAAWLVALATRLDVPVVVTEEEPEVNGPTDPRLAVAPAFVKPTFGLAGTPAILEAVRTRPATAVLVGFETDVCVYQSAVGLLDAGKTVIVVEDATFSPGEMHAPRPHPPARRRRRPHPRQGAGLRVGADGRERAAVLLRRRPRAVPAVTGLLRAFTHDSPHGLSAAAAFAVL